MCQILCRRNTDNNNTKQEASMEQPLPPDQISVVEDDMEENTELLYHM